MVSESGNHVSTANRNLLKFILPYDQIIKTSNQIATVNK